MRTGILLDEIGVPFGDVVAQAKEAARLGYDAIWLAQRGGWDALTALTALGAAAPGLALGTSVLPTYPRHPISLAAQALTLQAATGAPVSLGVGLSHRPIIEDQYGYSFDRPVRHLREYLQALYPLLHHEKADVHGETLTAVGTIEAPGAEPPSVVVGALSPLSLKVSGAYSDGVVSTWAGPRSLAEYIVPTLTKAATEAGRTAPRVITGQLISVTHNPDGPRNWVAENYGMAANIPAYQAIFTRDRVDGPGGTVLAGDEEFVRARIRELEEAGATELILMPVGTPEEQARTRELLSPPSAPGARPSV
ncbi:LLM class F420-dependent oxidoreductase [Amycolatopsis sp. WAC 01375]|uniref:TIGR03564 family F420-dependent LLM class oxidoreductase n=1 Tax=unclassified Amycolatopsis TaxID=2618356 RepID=UPI000F76EBD2|nr:MULTISPECIES: TIGR03564 family F420-dependent LLM class oxidoreductase [unclassified Amycolatopsis]RSM71723.1 LLM class F420-dependent oxidoreductase [Amycolatopsis sp. WAC 01375]RSN29344.1 LLM class F420-dependent oxidoreductase [Amycolatopsis sp. WAC 01416]